MFKLIRGIIWLILSVSLLIWSITDSGALISITCYILCVGLSISVIYDGWKDHKLTKK